MSTGRVSCAILGEHVTRIHHRVAAENLFVSRAVRADDIFGMASKNKSNGDRENPMKTS